MKRRYYRFNREAFLEFECDFKHFCAMRALGIEYVQTIIVRQIADAEGNVEDLILKLDLVSSVTGDIEELIEGFLENLLLLDADDSSVATATTIRVDKEDIGQFVWQYGHFILTEEHFADQIKKYVGKLQQTKLADEKNIIQEKIGHLVFLLDTTRLTRQKYLSGFLETTVEKVATPKTAEIMKKRE